MRYLSLLLVAFLNLHGDVLFEDDFDDGNDDGWTRTGAAGFEVIGGEYFIFSQGGKGAGTSYNGDLSGQMSVPDYSVLCSVTMETPLTAGIVCRYSGPDQWHYRMVLKPNAGTMVLERRKDSGPTLVLSQAEFPLAYDTEYHIRMQVEGTSISCRIWEGTVADEPDQWLITEDDPFGQQAGSFGIFGAGYGKVSWSMIFDDIVVSTPAEQMLAPSTWTGIKTAVQ